VTHLSLAERALLAAQYVNATAAVLLVVPMYLLGRMVFGGCISAIAVLLFQTLPTPAHLTSDGLSEGLYLLIICTALATGVWAVRRPTVGRFLLTGWLIGLAYLVRPEGLLLLVPLAAVTATVWRGRPGRARLGWLVATITGVTLVGLPYMLLIGQLTNKPTGKHLINPFNDQLPPIWRGQPLSSVPRARAGPCLWGEWWHPEINAHQSRTLWAIRAVSKEVLKTSHYVGAVLAALGVALHWRRLMTAEPGTMLLLATVGCYYGALSYLALRIGYVSERHTLLVVLTSCLFAASTWPHLARWISQMSLIGRLVLWPQWLPAGLCAIWVLILLPQTLRPLHAQRAGHKYAGLWLADRLQDSDWLVDPFCWAEWYAGRTLYHTTVYHGRPSCTWVVVEEGKTSPHSRLPQWELARELARHGQAVYQWPPSASAEQPRVVVYRVDNAPLVQKILATGPR
jgi:hypothetical protein